MGAILSLESEEEPWEAYFWKRSDVPSPWNIYWTETATYRGGLELDNPLFGNSWT